MIAHLKVLSIIIGLTLLSGFADAQGFLHAAQIWEGKNVSWPELGKSALGFGSGIIVYWCALKYMAAHVATPEMQTMLWFGITIVGVAVTSGRFAQWRATEQIVAGGVILGIGWLLMRTG